MAAPDVPASDVRRAAAASTPARATDRLLGAAAPASLDAGALLSTVLAARGLAAPADLASPIGSGDATLWKINAAQMLVVSHTSREAAIDDAFECGRIAATAGLSSIHARAAQPLFARLTCACPAGASDDAKRSLVDGVAVAMNDAGAALVDARLVDAPALRFDVLVAGVVRPDRVKGLDGAQPGDVLIAGGPLGLGIYVAANAKGRLSDDDRATLIEQATRANRIGIALGTIRNVHAVGEVGPEGLIATALAMTVAWPATIESRLVPALPRALALAKSGCVAPESSRNWNRDGARVALGDAVMPEMRSLLTDPHASGALLVACKAESAQRVLKLFGDAGAEAAVIGRVEAAPAARSVTIVA